MALPVEVRFQLTRGEFVAAYRRFILQHPFTYAALLFSVISAGITLYAGSSQTVFGPGSKRVALFFAGVGGLYFLYLVFVAPGKQYEALGIATREMEVTYRLTETGLEAKGESFQFRGDWGLYQHFSEARNHFLIYPKSEGNYVLLPKRAFTSPEDVDTLRQLLKAKLREW